MTALGHFESRPVSILLFLFTLTGVLVDRSAALLFKDARQATEITSGTLIAYGVTAIAITVVYLGPLGFVVSTVD